MSEWLQPETFEKMTGSLTGLTLALAHLKKAFPTTKGAKRKKEMATITENIAFMNEIIPKIIGTLQNFVMLLKQIKDLDERIVGVLGTTTTRSNQSMQLIRPVMYSLDITMQVLLPLVNRVAALEQHAGIVPPKGQLQPPTKLMESFDKIEAATIKIEKKSPSRTRKQVQNKAKD
jgi:hypothetical protein